MKIYKNGFSDISYKEIQWYRPGQFVRRLVGIHIGHGEDFLNVEPIYLPLVRLEKYGETLIIQFAARNPLFIVWLSLRKPFIQVAKATAITLEEDE